ncbi:MAG: hypothetical protein LUD83_02170, partial [Clostridiales bacterium]|nr:hypothetical protein [Clostridiales bacterium]
RSSAGKRRDKYPYKSDPQKSLYARASSLTFKRREGRLLCAAATLGGVFLYRAVPETGTVYCPVHFIVTVLQEKVNLELGFSMENTGNFKILVP